MPSSLELRPIDIEKELKDSFMSYAMAVIVTRALPDVRDGLKPVHRRILYSMWEMGLTPDKPYKKSARIVGDVLGKYHPHGDTAVYDAMVRLAQDFSIRYMLVEGQGNFGSVDGDEAAALRYTEARLSRIAMEMVADIDKSTVDFYPNFDETLTQPTVFPSRFPNLLVNGAGGIAVGMATNIPPHNLGEVCDGVIHMIDNPDCSVDDLMQFIKGPDYPTYGIIMGTAGIKEAYRTGRGRVITRARAEIEQLPGNRSRIVVNEIPYQVNKARLLEKIDELVRDKRLEGISEFHDESDRQGMRIVIDLKRDVNPQIVLNYLYKHTQMQDTFGVNMLALVDGEPRTLNLKQVLYYYIEHQKEVVVRRTRYELEKAEARAHILQGLLIALDHIDAVIALIRASRDTPHAREGLMEQFGLTERQAAAILEMRLSRLTALERDKLLEEYNELVERIDYFNRVLSDMSMVLGIIKEELRQVQIKFQDARRTEITALENEIDLADLIEEDDVVVTMTRFGYVKRMSSDIYRAQRRGGKGIAALSTREEDFVERIIIASTHTDLMFFTNLGRVFRLKCYEIPEASRTARGTAIVNLLMLGGGERVSAVIPVDFEAGEDGPYVTMATRCGMIKKTHLSEYGNIRKGGLNAIALREGDELCGVCLTSGEDVILGTRGGMCIRFNTDTELRPLGRVTMGVRAIDLDEGDIVVDMSIVTEDAQVLSITERGYGKRTSIDEYRAQSRAGKGVKAMNLTDKTGPLAGQLLVCDDEDIMLITDDGTVIRMPVSQISSLGRATQGVRLMRTDEQSRVVAVARLAAQEQDAEGDEEDEGGEEDVGGEGDA